MRQYYFQISKQDYHKWILTSFRYIQSKTLVGPQDNGI